MTVHARTCRNCSLQFTTHFRKQVYCQQCGILRDLNFGMKARPCVVCDAEFWPIRNTYRTCPKCIEAIPRANVERLQCSHCGQQGRTIPGTDKICLACVESSAELRDKYKKHLNFVVMNRKADLDLL